MDRQWMRPLNVVIPESDGEELDRLAREAHRRPKEHAAVLLIDAIRRSIQDGGAGLGALPAAFEAEGQRWFAQADRHSTGLTRRLLLQTRGEAWFQAAARLRAAMTNPIEMAPDDRPTAA
jgi:hypothetical protein